MIRHMGNILKEIFEAGKLVDIFGSCHSLNFEILLASTSICVLGHTLLKALWYTMNGKESNMKRNAMHLIMITAMAIFLVLVPLGAKAQENANSSKGQMKESGKEVGRAGTAMGRNVKHGRVVHGGKHFGKHMGKAGKHFGRGTKKAVKHVVS